MSYAIMRIEKRNVSNISGMCSHNERKTENHSNIDIDIERTKDNYSLIECENYRKEINKQIKERYTSDRNIRKDAVLAVEVLFTSDKKFFDSLTPEQEKKYFEKSLDFLKNKFGEKNVISAVVHKDETTPHMHAVFTPITNDGRLHFKSFINGKNDLTKLQDEYHKFISKDFDLDRGKNAKDTQAKNIKKRDFSKDENKLDLEINKLKNKIKSKQHYVENLETVNIIENNAYKRFLSSSVSVRKSEFETVINFAKKYISEKETIEELTKKLEEAKKQADYFEGRLIVEQNKKRYIEQTLNLVKDSLKKNKNYTEILEKKIIESDPQLLEEVQTSYLKDKWVFEKKEFIQDRLGKGTLSSSLEKKERIKIKSKDFDLEL